MGHHFVTAFGAGGGDSRRHGDHRQLGEGVSPGARRVIRKHLVGDEMHLVDTIGSEFTGQGVAGLADDDSFE